jgi:hypothetical protein
VLNWATHPESLERNQMITSDFPATSATRSRHQVGGTAVYRLGRSGRGRVVRRHLRRRGRRPQRTAATNTPKRDDIGFPRTEKASAARSRGVAARSLLAAPTIEATTARRAHREADGSRRRRRPSSWRARSAILDLDAAIYDRRSAPAAAACAACSGRPR